MERKKIYFHSLDNQYFFSNFTLESVNLRGQSLLDLLPLFFCPSLIKPYILEFNLADDIFEI